MSRYESLFKRIQRNVIAVLPSLGKKKNEQCGDDANKVVSHCAVPAVVYYIWKI